MGELEFSTRTISILEGRNSKIIKAAMSHPIPISLGQFAASKGQFRLAIRDSEVVSSWERSFGVQASNTYSFGPIIPIAADSKFLSKRKFTAYFAVFIASQ